MLGALTWQKYQVYDEYAKAQDKFERDIKMTPRGTRDILQSKCVRRTEGGLTCFFSKKLLSNDQYDVTSVDNNVYLMYGGYNSQRARIIARTISLGTFKIEKSNVVIVRDPKDYPDLDDDPQPSGTNTTTTTTSGDSAVDTACRGYTLMGVVVMTLIM